MKILQKASRVPSLAILLVFLLWPLMLSVAAEGEIESTTAMDGADVVATTTEDTTTTIAQEDAPIIPEGDEDTTTTTPAEGGEEETIPAEGGEEETVPAEGGEEETVPTEGGEEGEAVEEPVVQNRPQIVFDNLVNFGVDPTVLGTAGTPQNFAYDWLLKDGFLYEYDRDCVLEQCLQRFVLATFVYASKMDVEEWFYWLAPYNHCEWEGIRCDPTGLIHTWELEGPADGEGEYYGYKELPGKMNPEIGLVTSMVDFRLVGTGLRGELIPELGNLVKLKYLSFYKNRLTGTIIDELGYLTKLKMLNLGYNDFTSYIPDFIYTLVNLTILNLSNNGLVGGIQGNIKNLVYLEKLDLGWNKLTGGLAKNIGKLALLAFIDLSYNFFNGGIPSRWANLKYVESINLKGNNLEGKLDSDLGWNWNRLDVFDISVNNLYGDVPRSICSLRLPDFTLDCDELYCDEDCCPNCFYDDYDD